MSGSGWFMEKCIKCGFAIPIPSATRDDLTRSHQTYYCLFGHGQHYARDRGIEGQLDELRRQRDAAIQDKARLAEEAERARRDAEHHQRSAAAHKGQATRLKRRAANGVCPCCNRSFANLREHMAKQHPKFVEQDE